MPASQHGGVVGLGEREQGRPVVRARRPLKQQAGGPDIAEFDQFARALQQASDLGRGNGDARAGRGRGRWALRGRDGRFYRFGARDGTRFGGPAAGCSGAACGGTTLGAGAASRAGSGGAARGSSVGGSTRAGALGATALRCSGTGGTGVGAAPGTTEAGPGAVSSPPLTQNAKPPARASAATPASKRLGRLARRRRRNRRCQSASSSCVWASSVSWPASAS